MFPIADFSKKSRVFKFGPEQPRVDVGCCSAYWMMENERKCISQITTDAAGNLYETYFFSNIGIEHLTLTELFERVKGVHLSYVHEPNIKVEISLTEDSLGELFWAVETCIFEGNKLMRERPPYFKFYNKDLAVLPWNALKRYKEAQNGHIPFLLIEQETGSPSWGDSDVFRILDIETEAKLVERLQAYPCEAPVEDYTKFNLAIIDASDLDQPFNESRWLLSI